jgi:hypothetical protein
MLPRKTSGKGRGRGRGKGKAPELEPPAPVIQQKTPEELRDEDSKKKYGLSYDALMKQLPISEAQYEYARQKLMRDMQVSKLTAAQEAKRVAEETKHMKEK